MNPYVINRPEFDLVGSFNKGREASQNYQMNRQNMAVNQYKLDETKRLQEEEKKIKEIFGGLLKQASGNVDKAQETANVMFPEHAERLNQGFAALRGNIPDPLKRQVEQLNIDTKKQDIQTEKTNSFLSRFKPMVDELSAMTPEEQQASWPTFIKSMDAIGSGLPDHILESGLTPESLQELQMVVSGAPTTGKFLTFEERQLLEAQKQAGLNERFGIGAELRREKFGIDRQGNQIRAKGLGLKEEAQDREFREKDIEMGSKVTALQENLDTFDDLYQTAKNIFDNNELWANAGLGKIGAKIPGTVASNIKSELNYIVDNLVIPTYANAKAQGVTFGATSEKEWEMIKNGVANLDSNQSPENYRLNVYRIMKKIEKFKRGTQRESDKYNKILDGNESKEPEKTGKTIEMVRDPKTGKLVRK